MLPIDQFYQALLTKKIVNFKPNFFRQRYLQIYWFRRVIETFFVTALVNNTQIFSLSIGTGSAFAPASGIALAALFLRGRTVLFGIFLGTLISHTTHHVSIPLSLLYSACFTAYIFLIREICLRTIGPVIPLPNRRIFNQFLLICAISSAIYLFLLQSAFSAQINLPLRWLAELNGILYLTPLCLLFDLYSPYSLPTIVGIALLGLSIVYIGFDVFTPVICVVQAILAFNFAFFKNRPLYQ